MAQTNFTPILLYASSTAAAVPLAANLTNSATGSEIAINIADKNLFFKDSTNAVNTVPIRQSSTSSNGWLSSTNWNTFNGKQAALVSGTNIKTVGGVTLLGSGDVGTIGVGYGGTGQTSFTAGYVHFGSFSTDSNFIWENTNKALGISVAAPVAKLDISGSLGAANRAVKIKPAAEPSTIDNLRTVAIERSGNDSTLVLGYATTPDAWVMSASYGSTGAYKPIVFATSDAEKMRLDTAGDFFVGATSAPQTSKVFFTQTAAAGYTLGLNAVSNGGVYYLVNFFAANTQTGTISSNGTLTVYATTSDYRLKTVVGSVADAGTRIDALQPIEYDWNKGGRTRGFLAHQFAEVYPSSVSGKKDAVDKDGKPIYQSMQASTPEVMADLIAEIQSLRKRIATLENKL